VLALAARQHGVVARRQLLGLGMSAPAIRHRLAQGRLFRVHRGVYAVGRPDLTIKGRWMAAVLAHGEGAVLSHLSAGVLWGILPTSIETAIEVTVAWTRRVHRPGIKVHRRYAPVTPPDTRRDRIPVTGPVQTLVDVAPRVSRLQLEAAVNQADKLDLATPDRVRAALAEADPRQPGVAILRDLLDRHTFTLTDSHLEQLFLPIARRAGLPEPRTRQRVNGFRVDFYFPELGLVVETDGLRYHRTPAEQAKDRLRDQAHTAAGLTPLRFTHAQIAYEARHVEETLRVTAKRLCELSPTPTAPAAPAR
jgi:very-short-patch-repair endonuclease